MKSYDELERDLDWNRARKEWLMDEVDRLNAILAGPAQFRIWLIRMASCIKLRSPQKTR